MDTKSFFQGVGVATSAWVGLNLVVNMFLYVIGAFEEPEPQVVVFINERMPLWQQMIIGMCAVAVVITAASLAWINFA